jgi:hypothetical protein
MKNEKPSLSMPYNFMLILFYKGRKNFAFHNKKSFFCIKKTAKPQTAIRLFLWVSVLFYILTICTKTVAIQQFPIWYLLVLLLL